MTFGDPSAPHSSGSLMDSVSAPTEVTASPTEPQSPDHLEPLRLRVHYSLPGGAPTWPSAPARPSLWPHDLLSGLQHSLKSESTCWTTNLNTSPSGTLFQGLAQPLPAAQP